jgi:hypothetical protein
VILLKEETTMFKTISAALLAVSVLAAPAMAAGRTSDAPVVKAGHAKQGVLNANAKMTRHHVRHISYRHNAHKRIGALKTHRFSKVTVKHVTPAIKRG